MYEPSTGRWMSEDPIAFSGGDVNLYRYVGNDATGATDPTGLAAKPIVPATIPKSADGTDGFVLSLQDAKLLSVTVTKKTGTSANSFITNRLISSASNATVTKQLESIFESEPVDFESLATGTQADMSKKVSFANKIVKLELNDQLIYLDTNSPLGTVQLKVTGTIEVELGTGWIAPSMKVPPVIKPAPVIKPPSASKPTPLMPDIPGIHSNRRNSILNRAP